MTVRRALVIVGGKLRELAAADTLNLDGFSSTEGAVLYRGASGWAALGPGTSGYVLQTNGPAADPSWAAAAGLAAIADQRVLANTSGGSAAPVATAFSALVGVGSALVLSTGRTLAITGDLAWTSPSFDGSGNVTAAGTLASVNANVGSFGDATHVGQFTVNAKGLITAAAAVAITAPTLQTGRTISITGDLAYTSPSFDGSGNVTAAGTLATVNSNVGTFGDATHVGQFTVNAKGLITAAAAVAITGFATSGAITGSGLTMSTARLLGRTTASSGAVEEISAGKGLALAAGVLNVLPRVSSAASVASPLAWNSDNFDQYALTALANALTINADAGTPADGQKAIFRIKDNGTARALTWTSGSSGAFRAVGVTLPTTTVISKTVYVGCIYNAADSRWDAVAVAQEA